MNLLLWNIYIGRIHILLANHLKDLVSIHYIIIIFILIHKLKNVDLLLLLFIVLFILMIDFAIVFLVDNLIGTITVAIIDTTLIVVIIIITTVIVIRDLNLFNLIFFHTHNCLSLRFKISDQSRLCPLGIVVAVIASNLLLTKEINSLISFHLLVLQAVWLTLAFYRNRWENVIRR